VRARAWRCADALLRCRLLELEKTHQCQQMLCLTAHLFGGGGQLFAGGGILLGVAVLLLHSAADLVYRRGLFAGGRGDFLYQIGGTAAGAHHAIQQFSGLIGQFHAVGGNLADFLGGNLAALCQFAHFTGDDGKAAAVLAGACGFDGGIQRQQIGLVGNVIDDAYAVGNLAHGCGGMAYGIAALSCFAGGLFGQPFGDAGIVIAMADGGGHLFDGRCGFLDACG
jgi:hypothetical protein